MKTLRSTALIAFAMLATAGAHASGDHAGGHARGHDADEAIGKPGTVAKVARTINFSVQLDTVAKKFLNEINDIRVAHTSVSRAHVSL